MRIHRASANDVGLFSSIAADVFDAEITVAGITAYLNAPGHLMVLAFDGDVIVGQCMGVRHFHPDKPSDLYIDEVGTATSHLRQGVARAMLAEMFAWGREFGCSVVWLATEDDNAPAIGLYRGLDGQEDTVRYYEFTL
ncbi:GNAT family N-acetyltransferase [Devosia sp. J2-20]|uniref:GNAT family N-acetyltransferase n=1 Tax=Devosia sp. J2-20 TaxID=3026161 RepID=UPI00249CE49D|nr:GNAT family N-acetyltransferase [Devosia sp. J2-20]WDR00073.1 GNAT family N-acetyltransferase [Devosia sp. J2-20]